jgi:glutaminyl-tRNA synthetase
LVNTNKSNASKSNANKSNANESEETRSNFIRTIIDEDLASGKHDFIVTRFPPEPNGYLHIGHAKSIVLNHGISEDYAGQFNLRFDDTNPVAEDTEYVESIKRDVAWLGADWGEHLYFASDYFERMYDLAVGLIKKGKAYVDSLSTEEIREYRGVLGEPGKPSPYRDRSVEENLDLFERMRDGEFEDGAHVLRAKIDMANPNMLMRDPLLYRIRHATHHSTGDKWCIYPMYDYAHCLEDAFEEITHSLCTLEFENNRELYDWVIEATEVECKPRQIEFARLNLNYTVMSKRKLRRLVEEGHVGGWDDPRMPTLAGMRRRGIPAEAIRTFCNMVGVARSNSVVDVQMFEYAVRDHLNMRVPRVMGVIDPLKVTITNYPEGETEQLEADYYPRDVPKEGTRKVPFSREIYIDRSDFKENPSKGFWRLAPGVEVRLRYAYFITCEEVVKDDNGQITELKCSYDPETRGGDAPDGRNPKGTIHWVDAEKSLPAEVRVYDRLFSVDMPESNPRREYIELLNPDSLIVTKQARVEPSVKDGPADTRYQFEREGYFWQDPEDSTPDALVFNRIVALRDTWAKKQAQKQKEQEKVAREKAKQEAKQKAEKAKSEQGEGDERKRPSKKPASYKRDQAREENPALAARLESYQKEMGLQYDDADLLSGELALAEFFETALDNYDESQTVAAWIVNEMLPELSERDIESVSELAVAPSDVAALVEAFDEERITNQVSRQVFAKMIETGKDPESIIDEEGLERITDTGELEALVDGVIEANPDEVERYRGGKKALLGFFIGQVMQASKGTADAQLARELIQDKLES